MKKLLLIILSLSFGLNVIAHESGEPIKVDCFISNVWVFSISQQACFKDNHPEGFDEKKAASGLGCLANVAIDFILSPHVLIKFDDEGNFKSYDMKTEISFKDGTKYKKISSINAMYRSTGLLFDGEQILRFYNREEPTDVQCTIY